MMNYCKMAVAVLLTAAMVTGGPALAADISKKPSGRVTIDETQFGLILGGSVGNGKLTYKGKSYRFKLSGLSLGANVGVSKSRAVGKVYDLRSLSKFPGTYTKLDASVALGGGIGGLQMQNENGVIMHLESRTQGLQFNLGMSGVTVTMGK